MKQLILVLVLGGLFSLSNTTKAQVSYSYDEAGNRILRHVIVMRAPQNEKKAVVDSTAQKESLGEQEIIIYPNPTRGILKIELKGKMPDTPVQLVLMDSNGRPLIKRELIQSPELLDITAYPTTWYLMRIIRGTEVKEWKIIKQ